MDLMKQFTVRKQNVSQTIADAATAAVVDSEISNPMLKKLSKLSFASRAKRHAKSTNNREEAKSVLTE